ncbi:hypothetical protein [Hallerella succinigenes]|uniref:hypothetical protein n=1 Tax=Hallerella succinigenes TaxID=1896222 RepID=UPI0012FD72EC|nr:hypothetical protein [Hallerella succinigenes]
MIIVTQLADRISIIVKGFFHDRQKASLEPPAQLVVFGLYKKAKKQKSKKAYDGCHTLFDNL